MSLVLRLQAPSKILQNYLGTVESAYLEFEMISHISLSSQPWFTLAQISSATYRTVKRIPAVDVKDCIAFTQGCRWVNDECQPSFYCHCYLLQRTFELVTMVLPGAFDLMLDHIPSTSASSLALSLQLSPKFKFSRSLTWR
jgi:hypothetical protein